MSRTITVANLEKQQETREKRTGGRGSVGLDPLGLKEAKLNAVLRDPGDSLRAAGRIRIVRERIRMRILQAPKSAKSPPHPRLWQCWRLGDQSLTLSMIKGCTACNS